MRSFFRAVSISIRRLLRTPVFSGSVVATLTLAVGALTASFSVAYALLVRPLPYPESERLVRVGFTAPGLGLDDLPFSDGLFLLTRREQRTFDGLAIHWDGDRYNVGLDDPERVPTARVSPGFFDILGSPPPWGRGFSEEDARVGADPVVIVSHALWQRRWGGDPGVVGRSVYVDGVERRVVGIAPEGLRFPEARIRLWVPLVIDRAALAPSSFAFPGVARLAPGATLDGARADLERIAGMAGEEYPDAFPPAIVEQARFAPRLAPLVDATVGDLRTEIWVVVGTMALLLLVAVANVANLFVVRAESRSRELAVRQAMGAGRARLATHLLAESAVLAAVAAVAGAGLAYVLVRAAVASAPPDLPRLAEIGLDVPGLLLALAVCVGCAWIFALLPLWGLGGRAPASTLRAGGQGATSARAARRTQDALVVVQTALVLILVVGAGLLVRSYQNLDAVDPGFEPEGRMTFEVGLPPDQYGPADRVRAWQEITDRVDELAAVEAVGAVSFLPLSGEYRRGPLYVEGEERDPSAPSPIVDIKMVTPGYFEAMGIPLESGQGLLRSDGRQGRPAVVVNETLVRQHLGGGEPLGRRIAIHDEGELAEIVGVVADVRSTSLREPSDPRVYFPTDWTTTVTPEPFEAMSFVVMGAEPRVELVPRLTEAVHAVDPLLPLGSLRRMEERVDEHLARERFTAWVLSATALVALLLATVGIYGVIAYVGVRRRREIGVRMALGEKAGRVVLRFMGRALRPAVLGTGLGVLAALFLTRLLQTLLVGVSPTDPLTLALGAGVLIAVAAVAGYLPARRAARVDPSRVLRAE